MIVIADSGSTKCDWQRVDGGLRPPLRTPGIHPLLQGREEMMRLVRTAFPRRTEADAVRFYGAGCGERFPDRTALLREVLEECFDCPDVTVESDLLGAARALWGDEEGIACILGTGSNSCYCSRGRIVCDVPPLGYVLGDEGSGAAIGRMLAGDLFKGLLPRDLVDVFRTEEGLDCDEVVRRVYREPMPNRFLASFVPFVARHLANPAIGALVERAFTEFVRRNLMNYPARAEVAAVGGVACAFAGQLRKTLESHGFVVRRIERSPLEGLVEYHGR